MNCRFFCPYLFAVHIQVWSTILGRGPQPSSLWPIRATSATGSPKWWVDYWRGILSYGIKVFICTRSFTVIFYAYSFNISVFFYICKGVISCLESVLHLLESMVTKKNRLCIDRKDTQFCMVCGSDSKTYRFLMFLPSCVVIISLFFLFLKILCLCFSQYHLVCHDQLAQHPVPLRLTTLNPAMLCWQGDPLPHPTPLHPLYSARIWLSSKVVTISSSLF